MSGTFRYLRYLLFPRSTPLFGQFDKNLFPIQLKTFKSTSKIEKPKAKWKILGVAAVIGAGIGTVYSYKKMETKHFALLNPDNGEKNRILKELPNINISRKVVFPTDSTGLEFILFQYPTCPFCCKVRAFLDFNELSYNVIEVNPVLKQQLKWTDYKKVPILLVKVNDGYIQLNDSTMIISALTSYLYDKKINLEEVVNFYPSISYLDDNGTKQKEILNRYFLMYNDESPEGRTKETVVEERKWRKWADEVLVHTLSPNVYRSKEEALQAFHWFSEVGQWEQLFSKWERYLIVYVGAFAMWIIGKRLKKRHKLKEDVRQSLYDECNVWLRELKTKGTKFHGGDKPNLADLAVYGILSSIEGCNAFADLMKNTKLEIWYSDMKHVITN